MSRNVKFFYLKVKDSFFNSEEMKILEAQQNGSAYQVLYLKLCLLSLKAEGKLIFKDSMPYDLAMLSTILNENIDTVKTGIEIFEKLKMVEILDNKTIYMTDIQTLIGKSSTEGERIKSYRERIKRDSKKAIRGVQMYFNRTKSVNDRTSDLYKRTPELEIELETETETELELDGGASKRRAPIFVKPTIDEIRAYCQERKNNVDAVRFFDHYESNGWRVGKSPMKDWRAAVRTWERNNFGNNGLKIIDQKTCLDIQE